jgi:hypothetical protein
MVASPELPWQDSADSKFPAGLHRHYWQQAVVQVDSIEVIVLLSVG